MVKKEIVRSPQEANLPSLQHKWSWALRSLKFHNNPAGQAAWRLKSALWRFKQLSNPSHQMCISSRRTITICVPRVKQQWAPAKQDETADCQAGRRRSRRVVCRSRQLVPPPLLCRHLLPVSRTKPSVTIILSKIFTLSFLYISKKSNKNQIYDLYVTYNLSPKNILYAYKVLMKFIFPLLYQIL